MGSGSYARPGMKLSYLREAVGRMRPSTLCAAVASIGRIFGLALAGLVALVRIWYRAVLLAPEVKRQRSGLGERFRAPEERFREATRGLVDELPFEEAGAFGRVEDPARALDLGG